MTVQGKQREDGRVLRGEATRERVLDAAERLFADHGFDAVSIRQIAQEAEVTLGVVGFHSGSKEALFSTILKRRVDLLSAGRQAALDRLLAEKGRGAMTVHDLMAAYINPYIDFASAGDPQWLAYARLIAHTAGDSRWYPAVRDLYDPMAMVYLAELEAVYPEAPREKLAAALVMSVAAMLSTVASTTRMAALATGGDDLPAADTGERLARHRETLIAFCAGGIERAAAS
ncbi:TetR family transcriptional regulator [Zhengella mangrovi]|uniref:TetR family transcriptional regulator n=1 Tax=Zhengella mangrovi TaxID=1982044 RepID=A0A2G1QI36_9HYPH|nr:TetR/AcrR family transcriptional regulator [Zhengella mangrovi]PHP65114.1 TetR family transcriptional regulator [Zhengella mangrovi]